MGRTILGALVGLFIAVLTIMLVQFVGHQMYPPPPGLNPMIPEQMTALLQSLPLGALLFVLFAWLIGAFDGGLVAALIARKGHPRAAALVPGLAVTASVLAMVAQVPAHPLWMSAAGLLLPIPAALAGAVLAGKLRPRER